MPKKHVVYQADLHKNITRSRYLRSCNPILAEKLREILEEHKVKEKGK
ncbi:hypothetical protein ACTUSR_08125 [Pantoea stewartii subsp. indologenes]|jgi:hypothetical protein|nr:hypothetical protein [Pantoea stewartii]